MISVPLLQTVFYQTGSNWLTLIVMGGIIVIVIIGLIIYSRGSAAALRGQGNRRYSRYFFRREAKSIGLNKNQIRLMENMIKSYHVNRPYNLLSNNQDMKITFSKFLRDTEHMQAKAEEIEARKLEIYRIRQIVDRIKTETSKLNSTKQFRLGQKVTLKHAGGNRHPSVITANLREFYCAKAPQKDNGQIIRWKKGNKIRTYIWGLDNEEMVFESRILGYTTIKHISSVILQHINRKSEDIQRKYRRKSLKGKCSFYPVRIVAQKDGRKTVHKAIVVKNQGRLGSMIDISAGGCAIATHRPLANGDLIRISIEAGKGTNILVYGKIVGSKKLNKTRTKHNITFTRASSKNLNMINDYIYNFE